MNSVCDLSRKLENSRSLFYGCINLNKKKKHVLLNQNRNHLLASLLVGRMYPAMLIVSCTFLIVCVCMCCCLFPFLGFVGTVFLNGRKQISDKNRIYGLFQPCGFPFHSLLLI